MSRCQRAQGCALVAGAKGGWQLLWRTFMQELAPQSADGDYVRPSYTFNSRIGDAQFPVRTRPAFAESVESLYFSSQGTVAAKCGSKGGIEMEACHLSVPCRSAGALRMSPCCPPARGRCRIRSTRWAVFPQAEPGRYVVYLGNACPWCHRVLLTLILRGLLPSVMVVNAADDPERASRGGWVFDSPEPVFGAADLRRALSPVQCWAAAACKRIWVLSRGKCCPCMQSWMQAQVNYGFLPADLPGCHTFHLAAGFNSRHDSAWPDALSAGRYTTSAAQGTAGAARRLCSSTGVRGASSATSPPALSAT